MVQSCLLLFLTGQSSCDHIWTCVIKYDDSYIIIPQVYKNHAFIVSEAPNHGIQVFNLTRLRGMTSYSGRFRQDAHYSELMSSHNIVGNEETGYMYVVGTNTCNGGLHIINVQDPLNPIFEGCYGDDGYVHDAQCVIYRGPDTRFKGREVCFCYNEDTLTIVDVEDKNNITMLSRTGYVKSSYTHQVSTEFVSFFTQYGGSYFYFSWQLI